MSAKKRHMIDASLHSFVSTLLLFGQSRVKISSFLLESPTFLDSMPNILVFFIFFGK